MIASSNARDISLDVEEDAGPGWYTLEADRGRPGVGMLELRERGPGIADWRGFPGVAMAERAAIRGRCGVYGGGFVEEMGAGAKGHWQRQTQKVQLSTFATGVM